MTFEQVKELANQQYDNSKWQDYRLAYLYFQPHASVKNCNCNAGSHYLYIQNKVREIENQPDQKKEIETMNNKQQGRTKNQERVNGRFAKKIELSPDDFINQVRNELFNQHFDLDKIKKAYNLITGTETANIMLMRKTIISYNKN